VKIGNLKVQKDYSTGKTKFAIFGRPNKGTWLRCDLEGKPLIFDLQYDACCFLAALYEESTDREVKRKGYGYQSLSKEKMGA
jgi:hypothetical protein